MKHIFLNFPTKMTSLLLFLGIATFAMEDEPSKISIGVQCQNIESQTISTTDVEISFKRECAICLQHIGDNMEKFTSDCNHLYHADCIHKWMKTSNVPTCPQCRNKIRKVQVWINREEFLQNHPPRENQNRDDWILNEVLLQLEYAAQLRNQRNQLQNEMQNLQNLEQEQDQVQIEMQDVRNQFQNQNENQPIQFQNVLNEPNERRNVQLRHQLVNYLFFTQRSCWYPFLYLSWSILEGAIILSYVYVPKWIILFPFVQILNALFLFSTWVLQCDCFGCRSQEDLRLMAPKTLGLITLIFWLATLLIAKTI